MFVWIFHEIIRACSVDLSCCSHSRVISKASQQINCVMDCAYTSCSCSCYFSTLLFFLSLLSYYRHSTDIFLRVVLELLRVRLSRCERWKSIISCSHLVHRRSANGIMESDCDICANTAERWTRMTVTESSAIEGFLNKRWHPQIQPNPRCFCCSIFSIQANIQLCMKCLFLI